MSWIAVSDCLPAVGAGVLVWVRRPRHALDATPRGAVSGPAAPQRLFYRSKDEAAQRLAAWQAVTNNLPLWHRTIAQLDVKLRDFQWDEETGFTSARWSQPGGSVWIVRTLPYNLQVRVMGYGIADVQGRWRLVVAADKTTTRIHTHKAGNRGFHAEWFGSESPAESMMRIAPVHFAGRGRGTWVVLVTRDARGYAAAQFTADPQQLHVVHHRATQLLAGGADVAPARTVHEGFAHMMLAHFNVTFPQSFAPALSHPRAQPRFQTRDRVLW